MITAITYTAQMGVAALAATSIILLTLLRYLTR